MVERHLRAGWWGLLFFLSLGAVLELLHAIKSPVFVDAGHETTRLMLRLTHAHGTIISIINVLYGITVRVRPETDHRIASAGLLLGLVLLPGGFFLGALAARGGDPGVGIILVPVGALSLFAAVAVIARRSSG
jgi:hypothetical protein